MGVKTWLQSGEVVTYTVHKFKWGKIIHRYKQNVEETDAMQPKEASPLRAGQSSPSPLLHTSLLSLHSHPPPPTTAPSRRHAPGRRHRLPLPRGRGLRPCAPSPPLPLPSPPLRPPRCDRLAFTGLLLIMYRGMV
jgi:hypothetical protein